MCESINHRQVWLQLGNSAICIASNTHDQIIKSIPSTTYNPLYLFVYIQPHKNNYNNTSVLYNEIQLHRITITQYNYNEIQLHSIHQHTYLLTPYNVQLAHWTGSFIIQPWVNTCFMEFMAASRKRIHTINTCMPN